MYRADYPSCPPSIKPLLHEFDRIVNNGHFASRVDRLKGIATSLKEECDDLKIDVNDLGIHVNDTRGYFSLLTGIINRDQTSSLEQPKIELLSHLMALGWDPLIKDELGFWPVHWALGSQYEDLLRFLLEAKDHADIINHVGTSNYNLLSRAAQHGSVSMVRSCIDHGGLVNPLKPIRNPPLITAIKNNHEEVVQVLLSAGADANLADSEGLTAMHEAAGWSKPEVLRALVEVGGDLNVRGPNGLSPLHYAAVQGNLPTVQCLVELGANLLAKTNQGKMVLDYANGANHQAVVHFLSGFVLALTEKHVLEKVIPSKIPTDHLNQDLRKKSQTL